MNKVMGHTLYRNVEKRITGEQMYVAAMATIVAVTVLCGIAITYWALFGLFIPFIMLFIGAEVFSSKPESYEYKYSAKLVPRHISAIRVADLLKTILDDYVEEIKIISQPDMLFNEVWDQIEVSNVDTSPIHEYENKLHDIMRACEKIRKDNLIAGRIATTDIADLALETAKGFE